MTILNRKFDRIPRLIQHREDEMNDKGWIKLKERPVSLMDRPGAAIVRSLPLFSAEVRKKAGWLNVDCVRCWESHPDRTPFNRPFIACPTCGNKRCPKATDHELACTGRNDAGQPGSIYT